MRVTGIACGLGVEGSGWVVARGLVVTNAHVVAGIVNPRVDTPAGRAFGSAVVAFDVANDLAVLRVPGLAARAAAAGRARIAACRSHSSATRGTGRSPGRRLGWAERRGCSAGTRTAAGRSRRQVTAIRGIVEPGSSGGPGIDAQGRVRTTVFARRPRETGGYGISDRARPEGRRSRGLEACRARPTARASRRDPARRAAAGTAG